MKAGIIILVMLASVINGWQYFKPVTIRLKWFGFPSGAAATTPSGYPTNYK